MSLSTSDLPFGSEFSPSQIDLPLVLEMVKRHEGNWHALEKAILKRYFSGHAKGRKDEEGRTYNRGKLANNCKLGLIAYKIIDRSANYTRSGKSYMNSAATMRSSIRP